MPTYNYRLTGRNIRSLSPVESTDRILRWGPDAIMCSFPGCPFEICGVGGQNVMGGAMQEGWGLNRAFVQPHADDLPKLPVACVIPPDAKFEVAPTDSPELDPEKLAEGARQYAQMTSPWRCAFHLTPDHTPITQEYIEEHCFEESPEYQRGHADGFECAMKQRQSPPVGMPVMGSASGVADVPSPSELRGVITSRGGLRGLMPGLQNIALIYQEDSSGSSFAEELSHQFGTPPAATIGLFMMGMYLASLYFSDKYAPMIEAELNKLKPVQ